jgi:mRNA interferase HigB
VNQQGGSMHVISKKPFAEAVKSYPQHTSAIMQCYLLLKQLECETPQQLKAVFNSLDNFKYKHKWYVINLAGNHLRLLAFIDFEMNKVFVKHLVSHTHYDKLCNRYARGEK